MGYDSHRRAYPYPDEDSILADLANIRRIIRAESLLRSEVAECPSDDPRLLRRLRVA